jgi:glycosyltransferase involved in cell wall biosynthesis
MKALHVIQRYWPASGGAERYMSEISSRLVRDGHQVTVLTTDAGELEYFWNRTKRPYREPSAIHQGVAIDRCPIRHLPVATISYPAVRRIMSLLSGLPVDLTPVLRRLSSVAPWVAALERELGAMPADRFDLVLGMTICFESLLWPALAYARRAGVPFVIIPLVHLGEAEGSAFGRFYTMRHQLELIRQADAVVTLTGIEADYLARQGVSPARIVTTGAGADPAEVQGGDGARFRQVYGIEEPIVAALGTASYDKGTVHTVEAMRRLWAAGGDARLVIAGTTLDQFERYLATLEPLERARCHVLGPIDQEVKRDLLAASRLFVMPSRSESFGIVYLEAWLAGLPVIGAAAGAVVDVIDDGEDGFLVPFGDIRSLAERIALLLDNPQLAHRLGQAGRRKAVEQFSWDHVYHRFSQVYEMPSVALPRSGIRP